MDMFLISLSSEKNQSVTCMVMKEVVERKSTANEKEIQGTYIVLF